MSGALQAVFQNQRSFIVPAAAGQQAYTTAGTYSWIAPAGVTSVSVVAVGAGGRSTTGPGGMGGGLGYINNYSVTPGNSYSVVVGAATTGNGGNSYFVSNLTVCGFGGGTHTNAGNYNGDGGGSGGSGNSGGGGGAGGYSGNGGAGGAAGNPHTAGANGSGGGGGGGGGGEGYGSSGIFLYGSGGGGGVGILGQGSNGTGGTSPGTYGRGGGAGSSGTAGSNGSGSTGGASGAYGGGAGGIGAYFSGCCIIDGAPGSSARGAVRIIWAGTSGTTRAFPSTNTGDL